jgi:hypothetical protein
MADRAAIEAQIRAENPYFLGREKSPGGSAVEYVMSPDEFPEEYEARIAEQVEAAVEFAEKQDVDEEQTALRRQFRIGMVRLESNLDVLRGTAESGPNWTTLTAAQRIEALRQGLIDVTQGLVWLGDVMRDSGVFRPEDDE